MNNLNMLYPMAAVPLPVRFLRRLVAVQRAAGGAGAAAKPESRLGIKKNTGAEIQCV
jgi:hypothetical protein